MLSLTKSLPKNFKLVSYWDLVPILLRLYINDCFWLQHLNFTITLSDLFIWWQACKSSGTTLTPVSDSALQILSSKTASWISAGTGFNSIVSCLVYWELVTVLHSNWIILVSRREWQLLHCCNSEQSSSYFDENSLNLSDKSVSFAFMLLTKLFKLSSSQNHDLYF